MRQVVELLAGVLGLLVRYACARLATFLDRRGRCKHIPGKQAGGVPYLSRYYLFDGFRVGVYLHHIREPDWTPAVHDHPWPFVALLLCGNYVERVVPSEPRIERHGDDDYRPTKHATGADRCWLWRADQLVRRRRLYYRPRTEAHRIEELCDVREGCTGVWSIIVRWRAPRPWGFVPLKGPTAGLWRHWPDWVRQTAEPDRVQERLDHTLFRGRGSPFYEETL